jgi:inosine/xanthosine triphosphatase
LGNAYKQVEKAKLIYSIGIGSTNPVKRAAVENVLQVVFPDSHFITLDVPSGVSDQPWGDDETRAGAYNRAQAVLAQTEADFGVGLEAGVIETSFGLMTCAWCVIVKRDGTVGIGGGSNILLPPTVAADVRSGMELGLAMDRLVGDHNTKQKEGAIGILTDGLLNRQKAYEMIVLLATAPFRKPDYYHSGERNE